MSEPLDIVSIMAGFVDHRASLSMFFLVDVGPSATIDEVMAVANRQATKPPSRYDVGIHLRGFVQLGMLTEEDGRYTLTPRAVDHFVQATVFGCSAAEYASAPQWLRELIEERTS